MKWSLLTCTCALAVYATAPSLASASDYHHMHLTVSDADVGAQWYITHMDCEPVAGRSSAAQCGDTIFLFFAREASGPSVGSGVNHIGFSFTNLDAKVAALASAGLELEGPVRDIPNLFKIAFLVDPWGTRIELVEHAGYLGFHHVHLSSPEPAETLTWYQHVFGGERTRLLDRIDAVLYGDVWLFAGAAREPVAATEGRAIDHLGFSFPNLDSAAADMKGKGVEFTMEPREITSTVAAKIAFVNGPDNVRIEVVQPPR
jgi:lactoylglutathione lyase